MDDGEHLRKGGPWSGRRLPKPQRDSRDGVALVLTLLLLLIATAIVIAFLVRARWDFQASHGYGAAIQVDMLATGVLDKIVADTVDEIADSSHSERPASADSRLKWYAPRKEGNAFPTMLPDRTTPLGSWESDSPYRNLIKQSLNQVPYYNGGDANVVSDVSTTARSADGRSIDGIRWGLPELLGNTNGPAEFPDSAAPHWVYVQTNGKPTQTASGETDASEIVGRYAYNVYDVGGLLNINVAGHHGAKAQDIGSKGSLALVDFTRIPGLTDSDVEKILQWRSPFVNWAVTGDPNNSSIPAENLSLLDYLRMGGTSGWMRNPSTSSSESGNQFFSRRDLIKFFRERELPEEALPYLTHFNVDFDAPTFSPDSKVLSASFSSEAKLMESDVSGRGVADNQSEINPERSQFAGIYSLPSGKEEIALALHRRFPLSRLGYVKTAKGSRLNGSDNSITRKYFGLVEEDDFTWRYEDEEGTADHIKTLKEVAAEGREPNFFEVLKSVIQVGSLGQHKQKIATTNLDRNVEPGANVIDEHILRIGAAIIDQADEDSYPTRILFNDSDGELTSFGEVYGVENLPYLYFIRVVAYRTSDNEFRRSVIIQPTLWNPHNPFRIDQTKDFPDEFVIEAQSHFGNLMVLGSGWSSITPKNFNGETISFHWKPTEPTPQAPNFFEPQAILSTGYPATAMPITLSNPAGMTRSLWANPQYGEVTKQTGIDAFPNLQASGFVIGDTAEGTTGLAEGLQLFRGCVEFKLKYRVGGKDYTYDRIWFAPSAARHLDFAGVSSTFTTNQSGRRYPRGHKNGSGGGDTRVDAGYTKTDPRSQRFMWVMTRADFSNVATTAWAVLKEGHSLSFYDGVIGHSYSAPMIDYDDQLWKIGPRADKEGGTHDFLRTDLGFLSYNDKTLNGGAGMYYRDPDGVVRRALVGPSSSTYYYPSVVGAAFLSSRTKATNVGFPMQRRVDYVKGTNLEGFKSRPVILNRPFRSVGELAYAYRDVPWKNIDLSLPESGDTGLLDAFCVNEAKAPVDSVTPLRADKVNLNTCSKPVLEALVRGAARQLGVVDTAGLEYLTDSQEKAIVDRFVQYRNVEGTPSDVNDGVNGPLNSLSEIVGRVYTGSNGGNARFVGMHPETAMGSQEEDRILAERLSTISRCLPDMGTVRTWNLMADVVVQTGKIVENSNDLEQFAVNSESRWWMFMTVDRFTGKVLSRSFERIIE